MDDLMSCKICFQPMHGLETNIPVIIVPCTHRFCEHCIIDWCGNKDNTCPMCRMTVTNIVRDIDFASIVRTILRMEGCARLEYDVYMHRDFITNEYGVAFRNTGNGVMVISIVHNSPAASSGIHCGDIIVKYNGIAVAELSDLIQLMKNGMSCIYFKLAPRYVVRCHDVTLIQTELCEDSLLVIASPGEIGVGDVICGCNSMCGRTMIDFLRQCGIVTLDRNLPHFLRPRSLLKRTHAPVTLLIRQRIAPLRSYVNTQCV